MGGGVTVGAHKYGCVIDVNNGLDGDGPFSPERTGGLPLEPVVRMCYSGKYSEKDMLDLIVRNGGLKAYLGTNDAMQVESMIMAGDSHALVVFQSMAYQVAKDIGSMAITLEGRVDAIILTGGLAYSKRLCSWIKNDTGWIAPIKVYPGEDELKALAEGALRVLKGEERALEYVRPSASK
jgi:butyrate kinase